MLTRRRFLTGTAEVGAGLAVVGGARAQQEPLTPEESRLKPLPQNGSPLQQDGRTLVNDVHSQLNPTHVREIAMPTELGELAAVVERAARQGTRISIAGGRHAMGGQQFGTETLLLDMRGLKSLLALDAERGLVEVEAGATWPELVAELESAQQGAARPWGIIQKQTGADRLCVGGALAANAHGRGLTLKPMIGDVESFRLIDANGEFRLCSRTENSELFRLAIGGYGLLGVIASVTVRLMPRRKLERVVEIVEIPDLMTAFERRIEAGFLYGDCQFSIDPRSPKFLSEGLFSCYRPVDDSVAVAENQKQLSDEEWRELYYLSHADPARAYERYTTYYLSTTGQVYWSDTHQLSTYLDDYHRALDARTNAAWPGTEMITEAYVPRGELATFMRRLAEDFRRNDVTVIYGTIRLIEKDDESFLAWARESWVCVVMNLHIDHSPQAIEKAANDFRRIIDRAIELGGSYFLTYHRWATRAQVEACYPQLAQFLELKRRHDPNELFQSDWYRHYRRMFA
jgi:FAD/FMN-containing dehydrogenase